MLTRPRHFHPPPPTHTHRLRDTRSARWETLLPGPCRASSATSGARACGATAGACRSFLHVLRHTHDRAPLSPANNTPALVLLRLCPTSLQARDGGPHQARRPAAHRSGVMSGSDAVLELVAVCSKPWQLVCTCVGRATVSASLGWRCGRQHAVCNIHFLLSPAWGQWVRARKLPHPAANVWRWPASWQATMCTSVHRPEALQGHCSATTCTSRWANAATRMPAQPQLDSRTKASTLLRDILKTWTKTLHLYLEAACCL